MRVHLRLQHADLGTLLEQLHFIFVLNGCAQIVHQRIEADAQACDLIVSDDRNAVLQLSQVHMLHCIRKRFDRAAYPGRKKRCNHGEAEAIEDFNSFKICKGVVPLPADIEVKFHPDKQVTLKWNIQSSDVMRNHDCLQLAAFTPYKKRNPKIRIIATTETQRKAGYYAFQIPDSLEKPAYLYAFFKSKYTNEISDSYYLGGTEE